MNDAKKLTPQLFDREQEFAIDEHARPHWMQAGAITFITMRLADSIPREVILRWDRERLEFLRNNGVRSAEWRQGREELSDVARKRFDKHFRRLREDELDTCLGDCVLRDPRAAKVVHEALLCFDDDRYLMGDFVIMPNHIHLLAAFRDDTAMRKQCWSWMRFTARKINGLNGSSGSLWQEEPFDHLVRSNEQLNYLRRYIAENPVKAGLAPGDFVYRQSGRIF
ncbi:transposase [Stieleria mannarensis]|uniref:transposase n=1 Tax=Stieleria mannarensis TaxID=2755585 RepID=UPI001604890B|nr:transposase [Rhodopirellula sp. JC639]